MNLLLRVTLFFLVSAVCSEASLASQSGGKHVSLAWSVDVDQRIPGSPSAFSGVAFVESVAENLLVIGGRDRWVHVYHTDGGEVRRIALLAPSDSGALALANGLVVLGDTAGRLYAVDPLQGRVVWQRQLTASFTSQPVAVDGGFLVQTTDNRIYRFSENGDKQWSYAGQNNVLTLYLNASPLVVDSHVYAVLSNGDAVALKLKNGDLLWKRQLLLSNESSVLSELEAPLATPIFVPTFNMDGEMSKGAIVVSFFQGDLFVLSAASGAQAVSFPISLKTAPVIVEGMMYMADSKGYFHIYDIVKGERRPKIKISAYELLGPVFWRGSLWLSDSKGTVYRLSTSGETQDSINLAGNMIRLPEVTEKGVLFRSDRGALYMVQE